MNKKNLSCQQSVFFKIFLLSFGLWFILAGCSAKYLKIDNEEKLKMNDEFANSIQISNPAVVEGFQNPASDLKQSGTTPAAHPAPAVSSAIAPQGKDVIVKDKKTETPQKKSLPVEPPEKIKLKKGRLNVVDPTNVNQAPVAHATVPGRQPDLEDSAGFLGRRPAVDPFRVGEEVIHDVRYFKMQAGTLKIKVEPFVQVNQRKAYTFAYEVETSSLFSSFYSVQDRAVVLVDFFELIPHVFTLHVKESAQLREARSIFNFDQLKATYWEKKYTKKNGHEEKKEEWDILPYSQNVFSAAFYMRTFQWSVGKENAFRVSDNKENMVFKAKCIRRETLETEAGTFDALVLKPEITLQGKFKPVGDIFIWLSNDDRKYILRIESSIKIGTIVSGIVKLNPGQP